MASLDQNESKIRRNQNSSSNNGHQVTFTTISRGQKSQLISPFLSPVPGCLGAALKSSRKNSKLPVFFGASFPGNTLAICRLSWRNATWEQMASWRLDVTIPGDTTTRVNGRRPDTIYSTNEVLPTPGWPVSRTGTWLVTSKSMR